MSACFFVCIGGDMSDKRPKAARRRAEIREKEGKTTYDRIMAGEIEAEGVQKGWKNLQPIPISKRSPEERREICSKGGKAVQRIKGEEKTAKESLDRMLAILATPEILEAADIEEALIARLQRDNPNMTIYDAVNAAAIGRAISGNIKAAEYVRDTRGDKPKDEISIEGAGIITDADRALIDQIASRLDDPDLLIVKDQTGKQDD